MALMHRLGGMGGLGQHFKSSLVEQMHLQTLQRSFEGAIDIEDYKFPIFLCEI